MEDNKWDIHINKYCNSDQCPYVGVCQLMLGIIKYCHYNNYNKGVGFYVISGSSLCDYESCPLKIEKEL